MNLRDIFRAAFARGEARGVEAGAALRAEVAVKLDDAREEREARILAEAYAAGREAGIAVGWCMSPERAPGEEHCPGGWPCCAGESHQWHHAQHWCCCGSLERA